MKLILASGSPRRAQILRDAGIAFETLAVQADESSRNGESAVVRVERLALAKARAAAAGVTGQALVLGADTEVVLDGEVFGKPTSREDATRMLWRLAGRTHEVMTGIALLRVPGAEARVEHEITRVTFAPMSDAEIAGYVATEEHFDKTGGYAIQGRGGCFVTRVEGCYFNIVGLPLARLYLMLREMGA